MRRYAIPGLLALLGMFLLPTISSAQVEVDPAELAAARRELALAKLEARHYWQVEYPRRRRELNAAIEMADAELRAMRRQLREYEPFNFYSTGSALLLPAEELRLCILDAELRLRALRDERNNLVRFHADEGRLLDLRVAEARQRVVALEGGGYIELATSEPTNAATP